MNTTAAALQPNVIVTGPMLPEPVQVIVTVPLGASIKLIGKGLRTGQVHEPILSPEQIATLQVSHPAGQEPFDGDAARFRLGIEAMRLGLAYEYDPYFTLSIARVDPLPHQLEAVYDYLLKSPRIRFLLADDPGAGKTIMAGLLIKELKIRGLARRILIVTPANLSFQWQRELQDKFHEHFEVVRGDVLRANYGSNPWQEKSQVITSISWVSRIEDAKESLLRSHWDLVIVDEAHKMSAYSAEHKTLAYQLGEALGELTDHYLLLTATPHKGDPANFALFLALLDRDVYGDVKSLEEAMRRAEAPFYLRRVKEALVSFPDPETGEVKALFTKRFVRTADFQIDADEWDFYDALTRYVEEQSVKAAADDSARGRALGFIMAMLQRRFASSVYAVRRSLERMRDKRRKILQNPAGYRQEQITRRLPEDFDELLDEERQAILEELEEVVASVDPAALRDEIAELERLIARAKAVEATEAESKLTKLRELLADQGVFADPTMKLLIFTEHKDTLDYLAGDGRDGRPLGKLRAWGLKVTQIHGGMKIGDRDAPGTRLAAEREFREECQVLVATEAAGEGINLQFCWLMVNYDIPWNPVRLGAAHGAHPPLSPGARLPDLQLRQHQHAGGPGAGHAVRARAGHRGRPGPRAHRQGVQRAGRHLPRQRAGAHGARDVRPQPDRGGHQEPDRGAGGHRTLPPDHQLDAGRAGKARAEPVSHCGQVSRGQGTAAGARGGRGFLCAGGAVGRAVSDGPHPQPLSGADRRAGGQRARSTASAGCRACCGRSASGWSRASASWAASTSTSSLTRRCWRLIPPWNGSRPAIRCSSACARTRWPASRTICAAAQSSTI